MSREVSRRDWLGATAATGIAGFAGCLSSIGGSSSSDGPRTMRLGLPLTMAQTEYIPMNIDGRFTGGKGWKGNIEEETGGEIEVEVFEGGELGSGQELANKIQQGTVHLAHISLANLSPFAPPVDLINLPYFLGVHTDQDGLTQNWLDLHTSEEWNEHVDQPVRENGFRVTYWAQGPRALMTTDAIDPVRSPSDMEGVTHRTPGSDILNKMWEMVGANPTPVSWGETPQALEEGVADSMHPSPRAIVMGFQEVISNITFVNIVEDAACFAMSETWYQDLPSELQDGLDRAAEKTKQEQIEYIPESRNAVEEVYEENDVSTHYLDESEITEWEELITFEQEAWNDEKREFGGDLETVQALYEAMQSNDSQYQIPG